MSTVSFNKLDSRLSNIFYSYRTRCYRYGICRESCSEYYNELYKLLNSLLEDVPDNQRIEEAVDFKTGENIRLVIREINNANKKGELKKKFYFTSLGIFKTALLAGNTDLDPVSFDCVDMKFSVFS